MNFGHNHHHHHNHRREDDEDFSQPPPPPFSSSPYPPPPNLTGVYNHPPPPADPYSHPGGAYNQPPPPVAGVYHTSHTPHMESQGYPHAQPPTVGVVSHSHHSGGPEGTHGHHGFQPHMPSFGHHHGSPNTFISYGGESPLMGYFANKPSFRIYCKAGGDRYSVGVRDGKVVLCQPNPNDPTLHWYKDEKYSTRVKDKEGHPSFSLVNKATGQAVKHSVSAHPVQLITYKPEDFDESILWTESKDRGDGFRVIRMVNNVKLCLDAFNGDKDHGGVHDGTIVALYECWKGDNTNQQWKLVPY